MKRLILLAALAAALGAQAADQITIKGTGECAKCALKEQTTCQNVVVVEKAGKKIKYYLVNNDVSKGFHKQVCMEPAKVKATGTVKEVDGKKEFTATKIEVDKDAK